MRHKDILRGVAICMVLLLILLCIILATPVRAAEEAVRTNKQIALHEAADILRVAGYSDDSEVIKALQAAWWQEQEDLSIVATVIYNEADPKWCEWEHSVAVGAVVCNRVKSPYFPNTVKEVVAAPGQYLQRYTYDFSHTSRLAYLAAKDAMDGNHDVPEDAFWQDNTIQGTRIWKSFICDTGWFWSKTYICCGIPYVEG